MTTENKKRRRLLSFILIAVVLLILALLTYIFGRNLFSKEKLISSQTATPPPTSSPTFTLAPNSSLPETLSSHMTYEVIHEYPHDPGAFTQGLIYLDGYFYESTGLYGESSLRKVDIETGEVLQQINLSPEYFAEGLVNWGGHLIQLTWRENTGFVYDMSDFSLADQFSYPTEGWGLTQNGEQLIMSDGSSMLYFLDPDTFQVLDKVTVTKNGQEVVRINELEYIRGEVFANIWQTDTIVRIDPQTGEVLGEIDLSGILPADQRTAQIDVLNGVAYDPDRDRLFITGKWWPKVFEIRLIPIEPAN